MTTLLIHSYLNYGTVSYIESENALKARELIKSSSLIKDSWYYTFYMWYSYEIERDYNKALILYKESENKAFDNKSKSRTYNQIWHIYDLDWYIDKAYEYYDKAIKIDNSDISANLNFARILVRKWKNEKAMKYFERVLLNTDDIFLKAEINFNLSSIYMYLKWDIKENQQKSIEYAQNAIDINPKYPMWYVWVARILITIWSNFDHAEKLLNNALILYPNLSLANEWLWRLEQAKWNYKESINYFIKAIDNSFKDITLMRWEANENKSRLYYYIAISYALDWDKENTLKNLNLSFSLPNRFTLTLFKAEIEVENYWVFSSLKWNEEFISLIKWERKE
jgi:tetratricopeptide (TPR) repeat protein